MTRSSSDVPRVTVVVVVYDTTAPRLQRCLQSARSSNGVEVEVVVVDNASPRPVEAPLADRVLTRSVNGGFAAGVNDGVRAATHPWIAVLNDDAVLEADTLWRCIDAIEAAGPSTVAAAPKVLFAGEESPTIDSCGVVLRPSGEAFSAGAGQPDLGQFDTDDEALGPCMSAAVFRASAFRDVGPLDERYFLYYEDVDWALRCHLSGRRTVLVPTALAWHEHAASTRALGERRRFRMVQRNLLLCATANLSWGSLTTIWRQRVIAAAKAAVRGPDRTSLLMAIVAALPRVPSALMARRPRRRRAVRPDADAFRFADGLEPFVDTTTYRPGPSQPAAAAARQRLARRGHDGDGEYHRQGL